VAKAKQVSGQEEYPEKKVSPQQKQGLLAFLKTLDVSCTLTEPAAVAFQSVCKETRGREAREAYCYWSF
jgi:hypothetical protein